MAFLLVGLAATASAQVDAFVGTWAVRTCHDGIPVSIVGNTCTFEEGYWSNLPHGYDDADIGLMRLWSDEDP